MRQHGIAELWRLETRDPIHVSTYLAFLITHWADLQLLFLALSFSPLTSVVS